MGIVNLVWLSGRSIREKINIAFALMSVIPLLIMAYLVTGYIFPTEAGELNVIQISILLILALWVALLGLMLAKEIIIPVLDLSLETKILASGKYGADILNGDKELDEIASAVNDMTGQIKGYVGELQQYHERTYSLNSRIHRKVLSLTNLMRLGDMISSGSRFKEIADFAAVRIAEEIPEGFCALYVKEANGKYHLTSIYDKSGKFMKSGNLAGELGSLEKTLLKKGSILMDPDKKELSDKTSYFRDLIEANLAFIPMTVHSAVLGIIIVGNFDKRTKVTGDEISVFRAYAKELVLAYESEQIGKKMKSIDVIDTLTGLYSFSYIEERINEEINRAVYYQRACSLIVIGIYDFDVFAKNFGQERAEHILKRVGEMLSKSIPPVGKIGRFSDSEFAILMPERNKRESMDMAEKLLDGLKNMKLLSEKEGKISFSAGVAANPIDGYKASEIIDKAEKYMNFAKNNGKNVVIGWE